MASNSPVRILAVGAVCLIIGLALGGLAPRAQLRALENEVDDLQQADCKSSGVGRQLATALGGQPWKAALAEGEAKALKRPKPASTTESKPSENGVINIEIGGDNNGEDAEFTGPEDMEQALTLAKDAISLRRAQALAALEDGARPSDDQWKSIDGAINDMNDDLTALVEGFVADIGEGQEPDRREAMIFAADTLDVLLEADDRIYGALDEDQREAVDEQAIDPLSHLDEGLIDLFMELDR